MKRIYLLLFIFPFLFSSCSWETHLNDAGIDEFKTNLKHYKALTSKTAMIDLEIAQAVAGLNMANQTGDTQLAAEMQVWFDKLMYDKANISSALETLNIIGKYNGLSTELLRYAEIVRTQTINYALLSQLSEAIKLAIQNSPQAVVDVLMKELTNLNHSMNEQTKEKARLKSIMLAKVEQNDY